ncbi:MAG: hypothetical protein KAG92_00645, partial [Deltaproteobacteria bacterium]|nr:hypothetical protein [Deltaproteobacteria bacterium]
LRPEHLVLVSNDRIAQEGAVAGECPDLTSEVMLPENQLSGYRISQFIPQGGVTVLVELEKAGSRLMVLTADRKVEQKELLIGNQVKLTVAALKVHCLSRQPDDIYCHP